MTATQRTVVGAAATVRWQPTDGDGTAAEPDGAITVTAVRSDGTVVLPAGTAATGTDADERTVTIPAGELLTPDLITVTWAEAGVGARAVTTVEVVGAWWASIAEIRASDASLSVTDVYPAATLARVRAETEDEFELALGESWRPRLTVV
ncbi:MAG TPA: hypothetical protein PKB00_15800, partial [Microthrixaceae bacterium]|nr:hypothetical protein [Microthrixaceae bacterium]